MSEVLICPSFQEAKIELSEVVLDAGLSASAEG